MKTPTAMPTHDEISIRARQIWENSGRPEGRDDELWLQAERELRGNGEANRKPTGAGREGNDRNKPAVGRRAPTPSAV